MIKLNFDVKKSFLDNGLEVLTIKKDTLISAINIGVKVGANYEDIDEKGISHFIEHMLFKGTSNRSNEKLNEELESLGGEYNAYTDYDSTVYTISCLSEELKNATVLLSDMMISSNFLEQELEKERGVILAEIRASKDDVEDYSFKKVNEIAFNKSPLKYDVTGIEENVSNFSRKEIYNFYKKYYIPQNSLVTIVSPFEHEEVLKMVKENFVNWERGQEVTNVDVIEKNKTIKKVSYKNDIEQSTVMYLYTFYDISKEEELPLRILNHRLGESSNSLLFREIRENRGLAYDIYTHLDITKSVKTLYVYTAVAKEDIEETISAIDDIVTNITSGKIVFGEKDLNVMKKVHKTAVVSTLEDSAELCNYVLHQELANDDIFEFVKDMEELNSINVEKIKNVAQKVLNNPTVHILTSAEE